ncbi:MAG: Trk system potassium transporter TrkA [Bacteroidales bacterium]|nr:Trk system potassium transporter TrkA [Bacteroidales bacterium]
MRIVIAGAGEVGSHLAKMLSNENHDIIVVDSDENQLRNIGSTLDVMTFSGSATSIKTLNDLNIKLADLFIAVTHSEEINIVAAILGKKLGAAKAIARVDKIEYLEPDNLKEFNQMGIDYMIYPESFAAKEIVGLVHQTATNDIVTFSGGKLSMYVFKLDESAPIINKSLFDTTKKLDSFEFRAVAITRDGKTIIPRGPEKFQVNDMVYVISNEKGIKKLIKYSGKKDFDIKNIMILGGSRIGKNAAKLLGPDHNIKLIEINREKSYQLSNFLSNTLVINGDGRNLNLLLEEGLPNMDAFIAVTGNSETNILSCMVAKKMGVKKTIAEIENIDYIPIAESVGIDAIINKKLITASRIFRFTMSEAVSSITCLTGTDAEVMEFIAQPGSKVTQALIKDLGMPNDSIIGGIIRNNEAIIARGNTQINANDKVVIFALPTAIPTIGKFFN